MSSVAGRAGEVSIGVHGVIDADHSLEEEEEAGVESASVVVDVVDSKGKSVGGKSANRSDRIAKAKRGAPVGHHDEGGHELGGDGSVVVSTRKSGGGRNVNRSGRIGMAKRGAPVGDPDGEGHELGGDGSVADDLSDDGDMHGRFASHEEGMFPASNLNMGYATVRISAAGAS